MWHSWVKEGLRGNAKHGDARGGTHGYGGALWDTHGCRKLYVLTLGIG